MKFLLNMEEKRAQEREEDKQLRKKERMEDRAELEQCVTTKISAAIKPVEDKTDSVVIAQKELQEKVSVLAEELKDVQNRMNSSSKKVQEGVVKSDNLVQNFPVVKASLASEAPAGPQQVAVVGGHAGGVAEIISEARRTVGLYRIDQADLNRMKQEQYGGAKTPEEEKFLAVKEYLKGELKIDTMTIDRMEVEKMFYTTSDNPECLFVTFKNRSSVSKIYEKTFIMRKESRVKNYIPRQFRDRARAIGELEFNLRQEENCRTKIKMGLHDLQLFKKEKSSKKWELVSLNDLDLPPVDVGMSGSPRPGPTSPPPGRPCQTRSDKRGRESPGTSGGSNPKVARQEDETDEENSDDNGSVKDWDKALEKATLVTDTADASPNKDGTVLAKEPDLGFVTSISGTPAKKPFQVDIDVNSPVFKKKTNQVA